MKTFAFTALAIASIAGSAQGQCTLNRYGVPDFDQKRDALPNNGNMFCVPTSFTNIRGYIANHGYGSIMSGPRNWQSQGNYNYVTARIDAMGIYMDTDPFDGTGGSDAKNGWNDFIDDWHEDKFTLSSWGGYAPSPWIYILFTTGITNLCYGYYKPQGGGEYDRDGGHCVTLVGLKDLCTSFSEPTFRIRNPASDDGDLDVQSVFSTEETRTDVQNFNYDGDIVTRLRLIDFGSGSSTRRYMDKLYSVQPLIALTGSVTSGTAVMLHRPLSLFGQSGHTGSTSGPGASEFVADITLHPMGVESYIVTSQLITNTKRVYKYNMGTGEWGLLLPALGTSNCRVATSRFGHLFVFGDGSVRKYNVEGATPVLMSSVTPANPFAAMAYDDLLDEIVGVTTNNRLVRLSETLTPIADEPLPSSVAIVGDGSVVPSPTNPGHWYIASTGTPTIADVTPIPGSPRLQTSALISLPPGTQPKSMKITDTGDIVFINGSEIAEYKRSMGPTGAPTWVLDPDSDFNGLPAARALVISRSRTNMDDRTFSLAKWQDDVYEDEGVESVPDCAPDLNQDGTVDILDFLDFFNSFEPCQGEPGPCGIDGLNADYNTDGIVDILDMLDFLDDFGNGCA